MTLTNEYREDIYRFIWKIVKEKNCRLLRIGGIPNHIHILLDLNPTLALANVVRDIKAKSSGWLRKDSRFPHFTGWSKEYFAASVSNADKDAVIEYIKNQQEHHKTHREIDEFRNLIVKAGMQLPE